MTSTEIQSTLTTLRQRPSRFIGGELIDLIEALHHRVNEVEAAWQGSAPRFAAAPPAPEPAGEHEHNHPLESTSDRDRMLLLRQVSTAVLTQEPDCPLVFHELMTRFTWSISMDAFFRPEDPDFIRFLEDHFPPTHLLWRFIPRP